MQWDIGAQGLALLAAMAVGSGAVAALLVGKAAHRLAIAVVAAVACFGIGLLTSEVWFGWATEEELQPNIDGLSFDEALLSSLITVALVVVVGRRLAHRSRRRTGSGVVHSA